MNQKDVFKNASLIFDHRLRAFYAKPANQNLCAIMYAFGLKLESTHHRFRDLNIVYPIGNFLEVTISEWTNLWTRTVAGANDLDDSDIYLEKADRAWSKMPYFDFLIGKATEFNRPSWCIFGLMGMMQGRFNANAFDIPKYREFLATDYERCCKLISSNFFTKNIEVIVPLFRYFNERDYDISFANLIVELKVGNKNVS